MAEPCLNRIMLGKKNKKNLLKGFILLILLTYLFCQELMLTVLES